MSVASARVPAAAVSGIICLMLGIAGGVVIGGLANVRVDNQAAANPDNGGETKEGGKGGPMAGMGGGKGGGMKGGGKGGGGKGGFGGPSPKVQLAQLVGKLDVLTRTPLSVQLTPDQKTQMKEVLAGLDAKDELTDEEAKAKLDALLKVVEGQKETLIEAGYRWPSAGGGGGGFGGGPPGAGGPPQQPPNPFKEGERAKQLKSLEARVAK